MPIKKKNTKIKSAVNVVAAPGPVRVTLSTEEIESHLKGKVTPEKQPQLPKNATTAYLISPSGSPGHQFATMVDSGNWKDLRNLPVSELPMPESDMYDVWQFAIDATSEKFIADIYMGSLYLTRGGIWALTRGVRREAITVISIGESIALTPSPVVSKPCPARYLITGDGYRWSSNHYSTRAAAAQAAVDLVPDAARTEAGLEFNAFQCPNSNCPKKSLGTVHAWITDIDTDWAYIASLGYLDMERYTAKASFSWAAYVTCK